MSEDRVVELLDVASIFSGGTPSKSDSRFWGGSVPWLSAKDLKSFKVCDSIDRVTEAAIGNGTRAVGAGATLILVRGMQLFKSVPIAFATARVTFNQDVKAIVPNEAIDGAFLAYALQAREAQLSLGVSAAGHGTGRLSTGTLETLPIWLPSLAEQRRIAAVLDTWVEAIALNERLHRAKSERFAWLRRAMLSGKVRLPGFAKPWRSTALSSVLHEHSGRSTGEEPVFSVSVHRGLVDQIEHLGRSFAAANTAHYNLVRPGDIVYTKSPTGDFPLGIIKQSKVDREVIVSPLYGVFTPTSRALGLLLDSYFADPEAALRYLTPLVQKGAKNTIAVTNTQFLQGRVMLPSDEGEITALAAVQGFALTDFAGGEDELALLRRQQRGLMQKLLTGEWRVPATGDAFAPGGPAADRLEAAE